MLKPNKMKPLLLFLIIASLPVIAQEEDLAEIMKENAEANKVCLDCHAQKYFVFYNDFMEDTIRKTMCNVYHITPEEFYSSNHKTFKCSDCHSQEFEIYPHDPMLRLEPKYECLDCHGDDENYAQYHFENIYDEYQESVHALVEDMNFTCWSCHDAHEYHISARTEENIQLTVAYDNAICLSCHSDIDKYQVLTDKINPNIIAKHDWLPNQRAHFANVRCLECHTEVNENLLVSHKILPGELAVKNCVECHTQNSKLLLSLYKYQSQETRSNLGFYNGVILNQSYVIGANRNYFLNVASIAIFIFVLLGIVFHFSLRIISKRRS